ncbi:helix-turn-helix domain-containing protein [Pyrobaculum neutrophilum]|uniref:Putative HTH-type transcriptional regulatory protein Tneu_0682 n=1 Tax=Pyrobaculum neutrophilum (strain DSM 2338 / JCM 9278 / NBRC 100436 / V24Sta) TaxID=444157 RepID=B1YCV8_PYRNV|nr:helix-turn-helix domain-containing protein [Pyrobaculum neutrophilum]ACB39621.1 transcriptional regulator, XRE family [Pyrobaculum neutrophilum V24Sta]
MEKLLEATLNIVRNMGEELFIDTSRPYAYTLVAKFGSKKYIMRVASDADQIPTSAVRDLKILSAHTDATSVCLVSGVRGQILQRGVVYVKDNVVFLSLSTFTDALGGRLPAFKLGRGSVTAVINGEELRRRREGAGLSLGALAAELGVTRETVYRYERGEIEAPLRVAQKLISMFGEEVVKKFDVEGKPKIEPEELKSREEGRGTYKLLESHPDAVKVEDGVVFISRDRERYRKTVELAYALGADVETA